jgi:hypothetical protein
MCVVFDLLDLMLRVGVSLSLHLLRVFVLGSFSNL